MSCSAHSLVLARPFLGICHPRRARRDWRWCTDDCERCSSTSRVRGRSSWVHTEKCADIGN